MLTCRVNLVVAFIFLFLGEVRNTDDFRYLIHSLECDEMPLQFVVVSVFLLVRCVVKTTSECLFHLNKLTTWCLVTRILKTILFSHGIWIAKALTKFGSWSRTMHYTEKYVNSSFIFISFDGMKNGFLLVQAVLRIWNRFFGHSESESGSTSTRSGSASLYKQAKIVRKHLIPTVCDFFMTHDPMSKKTSEKNNFSCHLKGHWRKYQDPESCPDPYDRGTDPRIRIRTKMSQIRTLTLGSRLILIFVGCCPRRWRWTWTGA